jgi:hypothetical protein
MVSHRYIPLDAPAEWKEALTGIQHGPAHTWEHCYAMHLTTGLKTYLYIFEKDSVRIVCPITERAFDRYVDITKPFGFGGFVGNVDCHEFPHYWKDFAGQRGYICGYLGINPLFENSTYFEPGDVYPYNSIYYLDLTLSSDQLFANLHTNRKRQLRNWDETLSGLVLDKPAVRDFFINNYFNFIRTKKAPDFYDFSDDTLSFLTSLDNALVIGAPDAKQLEAVSVFFYTPDVGEYFINVSLPEGRHHAVPLLWYGVNYLKSLHIPRLNLGGGSDDDGVGQFKLRFGSKKTPLKSLRQIYNREIYDRLCRQVNADPNDVGSYFPAYRQTYKFDVGGI